MPLKTEAGVRAKNTTSELHSTASTETPLIARYSNVATSHPVPQNLAGKVGALPACHCAAQSAPERTRRKGQQRQNTLTRTGCGVQLNSRWQRGDGPAIPPVYLCRVEFLKIKK